jgi:uncharacterized protein
VRSFASEAHRITPTELLVIQPTTFCNIDCSYCYLPERSTKKKMKFETLELLGSRVLASGWIADDTTVIWHAGEPLVMARSWYEEAFAILGAHCPAAARLSHAFQTNGTLINDGWLAFFRKHRARVGVSLDGPRALHDSRRRTRDGRGTFDRTMAGVKALRDAGMPFHVITVLTADSLQHPDELFDFYVSEGIEQICFNVEEIEVANARSSLSAPGCESAYRSFLTQFLRRMSAADRPIWVREVAGSVAAIMSSNGMPRNEQVEPLAMLNVDVDGNLSTFSPELLGANAPQFDNFRFVNLRDGGPQALLDSQAFRRAHKAVAEGVDACRRSCAWFRWCGGGAPANKLFENGSMATTQTMFCRFTKQATLDVVLRVIENGELPGMKAAA